MSHRVFQNPHTHQKRQNDVLHDSMNMDGTPNTYGGSFLSKVHC